ncbi:predicted protein [Firmicutes bacterium CAG:822]|nr:predicted protein [Firmicutes bacterium CAG:822]
MLSENSRNEWTRRIEAGVSLYCAPRCITEDKALVLLAVAKDGSNLEFASEELKQDVDIVSIAIKQNLEYLKYADKGLQSLIILKGLEEVKKENSLPDLTPLLEAIVCGNVDDAVELENEKERQKTK